MALVVEDGSGKSNAESYVSVADASTYLTNYGDTTFAAASTSDQEVALRKATRAIEVMYNGYWLGVKNTQAQRLDWPRHNAQTDDGYFFDNNEIPEALKNATSILALSALSEDIYPNEEPPGGAIKRKMEKVGPLEEETEYFGANVSRKTYRLVEDMIRPLVYGRNQLVRA